jgi:methylenetetrahydrofolate dehydrogenase (NADP+)/methenyltetrahydrofolate cyclohydrolase
MAQIIDGKAVGAAVRDEVRAEAAAFRSRCGRPPGLATVLVGDDPASATYVRMKGKACIECGLQSIGHELPGSVSQRELLALVQQLNAREDVDGILVQLPLPAHIDAAAILDAVDPAKDVDGLHPVNQALLVSGRAGLRPCTPLGVMRLIDTTGVDLKGARAVVVGPSNLVGKPVAFLLLERHATLTICHSRTRDLAAEIGRADARRGNGQAQLIRGEWINPGSVVIDVGINRSATAGKLVGDVDFRERARARAFITPVPGGVGPMTIAMLLKNTVAAAEARTVGQRRDGSRAWRRTPLYDAHRAAGARMVDAAGWPAGSMQRHHRRAHAVRTRRPVRCQSHGRGRAARDGALAAYQYVTANDVRRLADGSAHCCCSRPRAASSTTSSLHAAPPIASSSASTPRIASATSPICASTCAAPRSSTAAMTMRSWRCRGRAPRRYCSG